MAAPKKQRRVVQQDDHSSHSDDSVENGNDQEMETIDVDFDVRFPEDSDRQGIQNLLQQLFLKAHINISELAGLLIEQSNITGVIKQTESDDMEVDEEEDMDVNFGVFSIVNLTSKKNTECVRQISSYLLNNIKSASSNENYEAFKKIIENPLKHVGLIISERFVNIPAKIAVPLYAGLRNDMSKAREMKEAYDFAYYLLISKIVTFNVGTDKENTVYINPEEELIAEEADLSYDFQIETEQDSGLSGGWTDEADEGVLKRRIFLLPASKWDSMYNKMVAELGSELT